MNWNKNNTDSTSRVNPTDSSARTDSSNRTDSTYNGTALKTNKANKNKNSETAIVPKASAMKSKES